MLKQHPVKQYTQAVIQCMYLSSWNMKSNCQMLFTIPKCVIFNVFCLSLITTILNLNVLILQVSKEKKRLSAKVKMKQGYQFTMIKDLEE